MNLAQLDTREGKPESALEHYQQILREDPKNLGALRAMADVAERGNKPAESVAWLKKASDANPKAVPPKLRLIQHYAKQRDILRALSIARDLDRTVPNNLQVLESLGRAEISAGNPANGVAVFRRLVGLAEESARAHHLLGGALVAANDRREARRHFTKSVELDNDFVPAIMALSELESREGNLEAALERAAEVGKRRPKTSIAGMLAGDAYMRSRQFEKALAAYEEGVGKEDTGSLALRVFNAKVSLGREDEAFQELQAWVDRKEEPGVRNALANAYIANKRYEDAIRESEKLLEKNSNNPVVLNNLAWLYDQKGDDRALATAERALRLSPESPEILDTVGWILTRKGDVRRGTDMLKKAHRAAPKQGDIAYHLAVALNKSGRVVEARRTLERILDTRVKFSELANAQRLLKELGG
jgi:putative PEP-CTERM system TPR-repeat lipoprotein